MIVDSDHHKQSYKMDISNAQCIGTHVVYQYVDEDSFLNEKFSDKTCREPLAQASVP
jgi:hypothetical protein